MYAYPNRFPWRLTTLLREHPKVCAYLDIPIQHAATPVLRAMRRAGSGEQVRAILDRLREEVPGITLRSTVLVGFPGESEADVEELVALVREYGLGRLGTFTYSPEEGTPGHGLAGRVPPAVARERELLVLAERDRALAAAQRARVGTEVEVLVDEVHETESGPLAVGRPESDAPEVDLVARIEGFGRRAPRVGQILRARVTGLAEELDLVCVPLEARGEGRRGRR
jgi:ribosomal protein S12 methylthiotransferase